MNRSPCRSCGVTLFGNNRVDMLAKGAAGSIRLDRARVGGRQLTIDTRANVSVVGQKAITVERTLLTTDPAQTGRAGSPSDVQILATGSTLVRATTIDSGRNVRIASQRPVDGLCLREQSRLEAVAPSGTLGSIYLNGVRGGVVDDGTTTFVGRLQGTVTIGACP